MKKMSLNLLAAVILLAGGCATLEPLPPDAPTARLLLDTNIDLLELDGEKRLALVAGLARNPHLDLEPGPHTLVLRFSALQDTAADDFVKFQSNPVAVEIEARGGDVFEVRHEGPEDISNPDELDRNVPIRVVKVRRGSGPLRPEAGAEKPKSAGKKAPAPSVAAEEERTPEPAASIDELKATWHDASPEERAEFMKWVIQPE